jgi:hypothetical protein
MCEGLCISRSDRGECPFLGQGFWQASRLSSGARQVAPPARPATAGRSDCYVPEMPHQCVCVCGQCHSSLLNSLSLRMLPLCMACSVVCGPLKAMSLCLLRLSCPGMLPGMACSAVSPLRQPLQSAYCVLPWNPARYADSARGRHVGDMALLEAVQKLKASAGNRWVGGYHGPHSLPGNSSAWQATEALHSAEVQAAVECGNIHSSTCVACCCISPNALPCLKLLWVLALHERITGAPEALDLRPHP